MVMLPCTRHHREQVRDLLRRCRRIDSRGSTKKKEEDCEHKKNDKKKKLKRETLCTASLALLRVASDAQNHRRRMGEKDSLHLGFVPGARPAARFHKTAQRFDPSVVHRGIWHCKLVDRRFCRSTSRVFMGDVEVMPRAI